jgi:hypothetical protein
MPTVTDALDVNRFREIAHESILACNLWLALNLACERGDRPAARHAAEQIAILTRKSIQLVNCLGKEDVSNG